MKFSPLVLCLLIPCLAHAQAPPVEGGRLTSNEVRKLGKWIVDKKHDEASSLLKKQAWSMWCEIELEDVSRSRTFQHYANLAVLARRTKNIEQASLCIWKSMESPKPSVRAGAAFEAYQLVRRMDADELRGMVEQWKALGGVCGDSRTLRALMKCDLLETYDKVEDHGKRIRTLRKRWLELAYETSPKDAYLSRLSDAQRADLASKVAAVSKLEISGPLDAKGRRARYLSSVGGTEPGMPLMCPKFEKGAEYCMRFEHAPFADREPITLSKGSVVSLVNVRGGSQEVEGLGSALEGCSDQSEIFLRWALGKQTRLVYLGELHGTDNCYTGLDTGEVLHFDADPARRTVTIEFMSSTQFIEGPEPAGHSTRVKRIMCRLTDSAEDAFCLSAKTRHMTEEDEIAPPTHALFDRIALPFFPEFDQLSKTSLPEVKETIRSRLVPTSKAP